MAILYLLSDKKTYTSDDIKYVSFESEENYNNYSGKTRTGKLDFFSDITSILKENILVNVKGNNGFNMTFSLIHDYLSTKIKEFCFKNLAIEIRQGVDNYRKIALDERKFKDKKNEIKKRYENFQNKTCKVFLNIITFILIISTILFTVTSGQKNDIKEHIAYMLLAIDCLLSTHYIYNLVFYFFRVLNLSSYFFLIIFGFLLVELCFFYPNLWGVFLGIEVVVLGICLLFTCRNVTNVAKNFLKIKSKAYISYGIIIVLFGFIYCNDIISLIPYQILFVVYVGYSNITHVKHDYMSRMINMVNCI